MWWDAEAGAGERHHAVVLVPPGGRNAAVWTSDFRRRCGSLARHVVRMDLRGQGRSTSAPAAPTSVPTLVADLLAVCAAASRGPVTLVGAGLGGVVAAAAAVERPDLVATLTLVATTGWYLDPTLPGVSEPAVVGIVRHERGDPERHRRGLRREVALLRNRPGATGEPDLDGWFAHGLEPHDDHRGVLLRAPSLWAPLATLAVPTAVVHGALDPLIPFDHGVRLASTIPGARLLACADSGHHLDELLLDAVLAALGEERSPDVGVGSH